MRRFTWQNIFRLQFKTLERRIPAYFNLTHDCLYVVKLIRALQIRNRLSRVVTVDRPCYILIREIYQTAVIDESLAEFLPYFQDYFSKQEWAVLWQQTFVSKVVFSYRWILGCYLVGHSMRQNFLSG